MWTHEESIETRAAPDRIWKLLSDVTSWKQWNAGVAHIEIHGPFASGTKFDMQLPDGGAFTSTLLDVRENELFTDETVIDGTRVVVHHRIAPVASGGSRVSYHTEITGPAAAEFGPLVTGDFAAVLASLKALAEAQ
jgi:uncharacterized protein YndB with AHSA1/START domain